MIMFPPLPNAFLAVITGFLFGFLLRKARVSRFDTIVGQLLLKDFTVMKVILTAIVTGSCGIYLCDNFALIPTFHLSRIPLLWTLSGGAIFGFGMALAGYCPGTAIAALGEGSKDMISGFVGMLFGSLLFNEASPFLYPFIEQEDPLFQQTIASFFDLSNSTVIAGLFGIWLLFVILVRRFENRRLLLRSH